MLQLKEKCVYDVKVIVQNITKGARSELEKLRAIWVWLCHNIGARPLNILTLMMMMGFYTFFFFFF